MKEQVRLVIGKKTVVGPCGSSHFLLGGLSAGGPTADRDLREPCALGPAILCLLEKLRQRKVFLRSTDLCPHVSYSFVFSRLFTELGKMRFVLKVRSPELSKVFGGVSPGVLTK